MSIQEEIANLPYDMIREVVFENPHIDIHFLDGDTLSIRATAKSPEEWKVIASEMIRYLPVDKIKM